MTMPAVAEIEAEDPGQMRAIGARLAPVLRAGDLIVLGGPLGAGKTVFVQGLARGLGIGGAVTSPTFVLARVHTDGRLPLVHVDAYRLGGVAEVDDLDLDADVDRSVCVVEWGAGLVEQLAGAHLRVEIRRPAGDEEGEVRRVLLHPVGADWAERLAAADLPAS
ncbi:tRNA (adenosine(37)-N6)-threonylcarbamoyltransferase complex ATPase subunit type 1 TsaE [Parafrankia sp. FMc2]|uniref:tRNA (adenosine(37)-N6)-threonylcarbamoyltransferase complex ATPase subunit type 1 TsaE n=1 Tax=Parafrankia sp. FMc2 TaxID=3233196 RepID=UPI0034D53AC9